MQTLRFKPFTAAYALELAKGMAGYAGGEGILIAQGVSADTAVVLHESVHDHLIHSTPDGLVLVALKDLGKLRNISFYPSLTSLIDDLVHYSRNVQESTATYQAIRSLAVDRQELAKQQLVGEYARYFESMELLVDNRGVQSLTLRRTIALTVAKVSLSSRFILHLREALAQPQSGQLGLTLAPDEQPDYRYSQLQDAVEADGFDRLLATLEEQHTATPFGFTEESWPLDSDEYWTHLQDEYRDFPVPIASPRYVLALGMLEAIIAGWLLEATGLPYATVQEAHEALNGIAEDAARLSIPVSTELGRHLEGEDWILNPDHEVVPTIEEQDLLPVELVMGARTLGLSVAPGGDDPPRWLVMLERNDVGELIGAWISHSVVEQWLSFLVLSRSLGQQTPKLVMCVLPSSLRDMESQRNILTFVSSLAVDAVANLSNNILWYIDTKPRRFLSDIIAMTHERALADKPRFAKIDFLPEVGPGWAPSTNIGAEDSLSFILIQIPGEVGTFFRMLPTLRAVDLRDDARWAMEGGNLQALPEIDAMALQDVLAMASGCIMRFWPRW